MRHGRSLIAAALVGITVWGGSVLAADTPDTPSPPIAAAADHAVAAMGKTLSSHSFSFRIHTIREYTDANGQPLHIFHTAVVLVQRPDHLSVGVTGDDGLARIVYDGKTLNVYHQATNKYLSAPVTGTIEQGLREATQRLGVDFPLADLLADAPAKAFLHAVTYGTMVNTVSVGGTPCEHLFFTQPPGIELELWVEKTEQALPRRLIVTYRSLPGEPRFIAELSDWKLNLTPPDSDFAFTVPQGATKMETTQEPQK